MNVTKQTTNCEGCGATLEGEGVRISNSIADGTYCPKCAHYYERLDRAALELAVLAAKLKTQYRLSDLDMEAAGYVGGL